MQITFVTRKFRSVERHLHCDVLHITTVTVARTGYAGPQAAPATDVVESPMNQPVVCCGISDYNRQRNLTSCSISIADGLSSGWPKCYIHLRKCIHSILYTKLYLKKVCFYSAVSSPLDRSKRFTLLLPWQTCSFRHQLGFLGNILTTQQLRATNIHSLSCINSIYTAE